jgi:heme-binding NEAT domain protein
VDVVDEDSKASENGVVEKPKENGTTDEKDSAEDSKDKEVESPENGDSTGTLISTYFMCSEMFIYTSSILCKLY